jgi:small subunit ribosomal protein S6
MQPPENPTSSTPSTYDLVMLLDTEADQGARAGVLKDVKQSISSSGELVRHDEWGNRELAYPIRHRHQAEYHLLQFHPADAGLLRGLDRSLRIADEVLRFRIVKLRPGTPEPPDMRRGALAAEPTPAREAPQPQEADSRAAEEAVDSAAPDGDAGPEPDAEQVAPPEDGGEESSAASEPT